MGPKQRQHSRKLPLLLHLPHLSLQHLLLPAVLLCAAAAAAAAAGALLLY
jgi:hypothetical protein